jgi:hypothetical protein
MLPFKYDIRQIKRPHYSPQGVNRIGSTEQLTGTIQGKPASDLEERVGKALEKLNINYEFRARISSLALGTRRLTMAHANMPGEIEIDHLIDNGGQMIPILIDGEIAHFMTLYQKLSDAEKTEGINAFGKVLGWHEVVRIPFTELKTQEEADHVVRRIVGGVYIATGAT